MRERLAFASRWSLMHFGISAGVVGIAAWMVFFVLYPAPWRNLLEVSAIFGVVVVVDVVCGPLLTFVLASPSKSFRERITDLTLVSLIQLSALGYGLWSVYVARPVALVFEVDRLFVVTGNEVQMDLLSQAPKPLRKLPCFGVIQVGLREAASPTEYLESVEQSIQGVTQAMRPNWWRIYDDEVRLALQKRAKPLRELIESRPAQAGELAAAIRKSGVDSKDLLYLPLTSSKASAWIALINSDGEMVGWAPIDGFE